MKASELIAAIEQGKTLIWDRKKTSPERFSGYQGVEEFKNEFVTKFVPYENTFGIHAYGWGSAGQTSQSIFMFILEHPHLLEVEE